MTPADTLAKIRQWPEGVEWQVLHSSHQANLPALKAAGLVREVGPRVYPAS